MVQKSRTGKKKRNPYYGKQAATPVQKKEDPNQVSIKKVNKGWFIVLLIYLACVFISSQLAPDSLGFIIAGMVSNIALLVWGVILLSNAKAFEQRGLSTMYRLFGVVLIVMSTMQIVTLF